MKEICIQVLVSVSAIIASLGLTSALFAEKTLLTTVLVAVESVVTLILIQQLRLNEEQKKIITVLVCSLLVGLAVLEIQRIDMEVILVAIELTVVVTTILISVEMKLFVFLVPAVVLSYIADLYTMLISPIVWRSLVTTASFTMAMVEIINGEKISMISISIVAVVVASNTTKEITVFTVFSMALVNFLRSTKGGNQVSVIVAIIPLAKYTAGVVGSGMQLPDEQLKFILLCTSFISNNCNTNIPFLVF